MADEEGHPKQEGRFLLDGSYELRIFYGDSRELVMDIARYAPRTEVIEPSELRREVAEYLGQCFKTTAPYFRYWGKAKPGSEPPYHPLAFHSLDLAAVGRVYLLRHTRLLSFFHKRWVSPIE